MPTNKDCKIEPRSQQFLLFDKLHVLGAVFGPTVVDPVSGVNVFQTLGPSNYNNAIPHGIYDMIAIHSDSHPTKGIMNTIDNWSISHQESGVEAETKIYKMNTSYLDDIKYSSTDKSQEYLETKYIKASTFYEIPTQNILSAGIIKNKVEDKWDLCLIDEGNEKCNYTLEARLFTHGEIDSEVDQNSPAITGLEGLDNYVFYNTGDNDNYPSYGYFLGMIGALPVQDITSSNIDIINKYKAEVALQHYYIFDEYNRHQSETPVGSNKPTANWFGWQTNLFQDSQVLDPVNMQTIIRYKDLRDINPNNVKYQTTHFNFFTNQKNSMLANKFACNQDFAVGRYPGAVVTLGNTMPFPADDNYNIADGYVGGTEPNRYYLCYNQYIGSWSNGRNEPPYRYLGSVLSNPNAYTELLMMHNGGRIVSGFNLKDLVSSPTSPASIIDTIGTVNCPCNSGKQTNECLAGIPGQGAYASNAAGEALYKTSLKSGCNKLQFNLNANMTSHAYTHGIDTNDGVYTLNFSRQGYLYDRDVMLFAPAPDSYNINDWNNNSAAPEGTYLGNMMEETGLYNPISGKANGPGSGVPTEASEIEFELFYCANINTPTAAMTLLEFGKKLNKKISNFDTKIFNHATGWAFNDDPGIAGTEEVNHVYIRPLEDFSTASIIYGSKTQIDSSIFGHEIGNDTDIEANGGINIIPTVEINNVYIWEKGGAPYKGSKKLEGTKITLIDHSGGYYYRYELYSYGEYFIAYFAHKLFLIDKITFDRYMYDAEEFTELIQELAYNPCASDYSGTNKKYSDFGDPWKVVTGESAIYHNSTFTDSTESGSPAFLRNGYTWGITNN